MDKKKQMAFNLNNFLLSFSEILDSKKTSYIALNLALEYSLEAKKLADLCSYSLIANLSKDDIKKFDFIDKAYFEDKVFQDIVKLSNDICKRFDFHKNSIKQRVECLEYIKNNEDIYSKDLIEKFCKISNKLSFWLDLENESEIVMFIYSNLSDFTKVLDFEDILNMTTIFHKFQNLNSKILKYASIITDYFEFEHKDKQIFLIAISLQNIGKLYIPKEILEKIEPLTYEEKEIIKSYPYHTKRVLNSIMGFADICNLSFKVQERLDGSGTFGLSAKDLSFKDRLLISLVIYSALREKKDYRDSFSHKETIEIMKNEAKNGKIDESIVDIFDKILE
ncbi:HD-GYP domain-containing protein [Aliarcobacter vitoriensis]|uniref:Phosphohydrolase n=1 Tax=Aliarcobacter vitoriensis TaxID=2011099 RepID=A0A366MR70_9BACT|nr:HD domain-containing phosphohydrolase [Aliarcobacter vitoriensis]RBQ28333.1 phosphohydrolase [Aliarcobacter vitoriensis]